MSNGNSFGDPVLERWRRAVRVAIPSADADLAEEVAQHVTARWRALKAEGMNDQDADCHVQRELAEWRHLRIPSRRTSWGLAAMRVGWGVDARYAARSLRVRPLFTVSAALLATVAIAANVAAFAIAYGLLWRPLPYPDGDRLAVVWQVREGQQGQISYPDYADITQSSVFDAVAAMSGGRGSLRLGDRIERVNLLEIEAPGFALLGATPALGRLLHAGDAGQPLALISHRLWRTHLDADPHVVGRVLWLSGRDYTVVGVLAPGFDFELPVTPTLRLEQHDLWTVLDRASPFVTRRDVSGYEAIVRRAPGVSLAQAQAAVDAVGQRLARAHDSTNRERTFRVTGLQDEMVRGVRRPILAGCVGAIVTLVIALVNLMTLALGRLSDRQTELAIRQALGAGTERLRRQLLTEHGVLAAIGGLGGFALATVLVRMLAASEAAHLPRVDAIRFDGPVRLAALALTALIVLVLTLLPVRLGDTMGLLGSGARAGGRSTRRFRQWLVAGELALAVALTTGSALLGLSLTRLFDVDPGFAPDNVLAARVSAYSGRYPSAEHVQRFFSSVIDTLERAPGIARAAAGSSLPLSGQMTGTSVMARGRPVQPGSRLSAGWQFVTPGYFAAIGMPVRRGRDFSDDDRVHAGHVTIVNEELARSLFPNEDPVGKLVAVGGGDAQDDWHEIVGVVGDVRHHALTASPEPRVYDLLGDHWGRTLYVVVRSRTADAAAAAREVRVAVASLDPEAPVFETATMAALVERSAAPHRLAAGLAGGLALAGLLLALIGVYAVAAASVAERAREIGIRAALGARPIDLLALVVRDSLLTAIVGGAMGAAGSLATSRLLASQLFGVRPADVGVVVPVVGAVLMTIAVMATLPAARRAAGADPLVAIRAE